MNNAKPLLILFLLAGCAGDLEALNSRVNREIIYKSDQGDYWQQPYETVSLGTGDCEDYAILKLSSLPEAYEGSLVLVFSLDRLEYHMITRAEKDGEVYYLDNLFDQPIPEENFNQHYKRVSDLIVATTSW